MGVPKFYRWISERYPCLSQVVKDYQIPEFDNLYLDMNGIIHTCSHPNDDDPSFRISEDKIFSNIFTYLEALFRIIKPQRVLFLAVDGVAPRAKMNQQRGRRFRSAKEAQDLVRRALQKGQVMPAEPRFDSNCITPGTDFMARLHEHLKYFVAMKVSTDPTWQKVEVVLSGHDVPGEGEHKIMDYIRHQKARPDYNPNTRHCLYGLDADLIMLGLLSHEPHFSLLREEVRFGKSQKKQTTPDTITFHLLHLSILREYLDFEFQPLKDKVPFGYDLEKIIDDWVLMGFLVGNDFLPNLPNFHIRQDSLPFLYTKYMEVLPTLDGYINNGGNLNMAAFETYLRAVSQFDVDHYSELFDDMKWLEGKSQLGPKSRDKSKKGSTEHAQKKESPDDTFPAGLAGFAAGVGEDEVDYDEDSEKSRKIKRDLGISSLKSYFQDEDKDLDKNFSKEFIDFKATYYQQKMGFIHVDQSVLVEQAKCYVVGIQWVLHYYYSGVPSWSWFYPYHYAPFVSDIRRFSDILIEFELGKPFFPFEQLLAVLPPASKALLPKAFQGLMVNEDSQVKDFYPISFQTDLNGKDQEWEAVVLIPFIDEERLLQAMATCLPHLTQEEVSRNGFGKCLISHYDDAAPTTTYPSPWPQVFPELSNCKISCTELPPNPFPIDKEHLVRGLCAGVKLDVHFPGFPSLKHVPHTGTLEKKGVRVFQAASRGENLFLTVLLREAPKTCLQVAQELVGKTLFVDWPYLAEAKVCAVSDGREKYYHSSSPNGALRKEELSETAAKQWKEDKTIICRRYMERQGINVGNVELLIYAQVLQGKRYVVNKRGAGAKGMVALVKEWSPIPEPFIYQTTVKDIAAFAPEYKEPVTSLTELFPPKSHCFIVSPPHYGSLAEVLSVDMNQLRVQVKVIPQPEPELDSVVDNRRLSIHYLHSHVVAGKVKLPGVTLGRITGNILVEKGSRDNVKSREKVKIGLNWKFTKRNQEILGYARKQENGGWSFSPEAVDILKQFIQQFPGMFGYITANPTEDVYYEQDLFPDPEGSESINAVKEWLKKLPSEGADAVDCGSETLDKPHIAAIEKAVLDMQRQKTGPLKPVKLRVKPSALYKPADRQGNLIPDPDADFFLFDRVINVSATSAVPFALRGTVTGIMGPSKDNSPPMYEVLFDEDFLGGLKLRCSSNRAYRLPASCLLSISHGKRVEENKKGKSHKGYTQSGTSYASAAAHNQYAQPLTYGGNVQGQSRPYRYSEHQSFADSPRPRVSYDDQSARNVRLPKSGRGSTSGRGRGDRASEVKKIMQRDSSEFTQPIKQSTKESSHDELSSAMDALSKLSTQPPKLMQKPEPTEQTDRDEKRELSPSVAAMFSAHEKQAASSQESSTQLAGGVSSAQDQTSNLKNILRIGDPKKHRPPHEKEMPESIRKLAGGQPRAPLLSRPPPQYPQQQQRGPIFPQGPVYPYGPPTQDPLTMLHQTAYAHGYHRVNVFHRNTPQGFVGFVEVGSKKYTGLPSANAAEARQSAAAIANADLIKSVYGYPLPYTYPMMMPPQPRYDGPPMPFYPPPPQQPPLRPTRHVSAQHLPGRGILSNPFVPLQVQRKHPVRSSPEKKPTTTAPVEFAATQRQVSSEEAQRREMAKQEIMQSLNILPQGQSQEPPTSDTSSESTREPQVSQEGVVDTTAPPLDEGAPVSEEQLTQQVNQSLQEIQQTKETLERLGGIINAVAASSGDLPEHDETVPVDESTASTPGGPHVGDAFVHVALAGGLNENPDETEQYAVAVQPEDTAKPSVEEVTIAGEIVGTMTNLESVDSSGVDTGIGSQAGQSTTTIAPKKSKRQLAASFMNS